MNIAALVWPLARLGEAIDLLGSAGARAGRTAAPPAPPAALALDETGRERWIVAAAASLGLEAEPVTTRIADLEGVIAGPGAALLSLPGDGPPRFLVVAGGRRGVSEVVGPDLVRHRVAASALARLLAAGIETKAIAAAERLLDEARVAPRRRPRARAAIVRERVGGREIGGVFLLSSPAGASFAAQLRQARLPRHLATLVASHLVQYLLWLFAWWVVGRAAFGGHLDRGWLVAWALVLLTAIPFRLAASRAAGLAAIAAGGLLKQRLLHGALRLEPEEIRHQGAGQLLGRVIEAEALEAMALNGGFLAVLVLLETAAAAVVLALGASPVLLPGLLLLWVLLAAALAWRCLDERRAFTASRLAMTTDLVERMVGHRTRLAQESPERRHEGEDQALDRYLELSRRLDSTAARLLVLVPRGWLLAGIAALSPVFVSGTATPAELAVALGGVLLAYQALERAAAAVTPLTGALTAWRQTAPLFHAAGRPSRLGSPDFATAAPAVDAGTAVVETHDLGFRYRPQAEPVLRSVAFRVEAEDRVLLEGPSGGGKSTLASLLVGLRDPSSGLVLLGGLDRQTLGDEGWRRRAVSAPQFHENHVFAATFAFNLLLGRRWPPRPDDLAAAEALCRDLSLGPLLERMPAGLQQMVGETGWQLSHGEKSRLYIARALLQEAELVVLDESFAALDPETLGLALRTVIARAPALIVVAHP